MERKVYLTGIKPTGIPHIGNYLGAIRPALDLYRENFLHQQFYFIADYHSLTTLKDPRLVKEYTASVAATWLALGLNPKEIIFYKQSDIPELFELSWILACVTPKGLMNRAHAYKAMVAVNEEKGIDGDAHVNMGLFTYPILMAADILMFKTNIVPVGKDQLQHVEIARDIGSALNHIYGDVFQIPEAFVKKESKIIDGNDGRKMSKSYNNAINIFATEPELEKYIKSIKTDSSSPTEPKDTENSLLFSLYSQFASEKEAVDLKNRYQSGIAWGEVKRLLFEQINNELKESRKLYYEYISQPKLIDEYLQEGARQARALAKPFLAEIKEKLGIK